MLISILEPYIGEKERENRGIQVLKIYQRMQKIFSLNSMWSHSPALHTDLCILPYLVHTAMNTPLTCVCILTIAQQFHLLAL